MSTNGSDETRFYNERFGSTIDFGACVAGPNLNLLAVRGFGPLDALSYISAPDVFDQAENKTGTQRALKAKHAKECFDYAMNSMEVLSEEAPHAFPEIILNVRDTNVLELYLVDDPTTNLEIDSFNASDVPESGVLGVRVRVSALSVPKAPFNPQISRVDGNHRLFQADALLARAAADEEIIDFEFPQLAFAMFIGLTPIQEARLFRDINGEQVGMETAHLDSILIRMLGERLLETPKGRPLWLANKLTEPGRAFEDMVFFGGATAGVKRSGDGVPPVRINSLKTTLTTQVKAAPVAEANFGDKPQVLLQLLDNYWKAVARVFPDAWADKHNYILLQSIGLGAFALLGGELIDRCIQEGKFTVDDFAHYLEVVRERVPLDRTDPSWAGVAGAGGAKVVARALIRAAEPNAARMQKIAKEVTGGEDPISEKLEAAASSDGSES